MPWLTKAHECKLPHYVWRKRPKGSNWQCNECNATYVVNYCLRFAMPWYEVGLVRVPRGGCEGV